eukprot:TRINITY_DN1476_c0_g1_i1.p1 TRINITY_DN1476_c0_g1~~TRINITY_DN1476_c0_g1_i1.p1  ORF type:complete len:241 (+),score=89.76 TRINITY_DN1476_c0_g1_i1:95-817(+)
MAKVKLYGIPLSQPYRAVAWLLVLNNEPFEIEVAVPRAPGPKGTRSPEYMAKFPAATVPALEEADGFVLHESNAMMQYLCGKHGWEAWYPQDLRRRAQVDQVLHWFHRSLRELTIEYVRPVFLPDTAGDAGRNRKAATVALKILERHYLASAPYLTGTAPTIADLAAYEEVVQLRFMNLLDFAPYPKVAAWLDRMAGLPGHDAVHAPLIALAAAGAVNAKTMKQANLAGLKALSGAVAKL